MITFENGQLIEGEYVQTEAYIEDLDGTKHYLKVPKIEGTTPMSAENLNTLQKDLIEHRSVEVITARNMTEDMEFTLTNYYEVGNDSLKLFLCGQLLENGVHYREGKFDETSQIGDVTNKITLLTWGSLSKDYDLTVIITGNY